MSRTRLVELSADLSTVSFEVVARHMQVLMLRNFATSAFAFQKGALRSRPGCIIASPSLAQTDGGQTVGEDYVYHWVRDAAVSVVEAIDNPIFGNSIFDAYIEFSRLCQQNNIARACFNIDGSPRYWTDQADGPADRITSVTKVFSWLSPPVRQVALNIIQDDLEYVLSAYQGKTVNVWEETEGYVFYARSVQLQALERLILEPDKLRIAPEQQERVLHAIVWLCDALKHHIATRSDGSTYYRAILEAEDSSGGSTPRGADLNVDVVMTIVHGSGAHMDDALLSTAARLRDYFDGETSVGRYPINEADRARGIGPLIGRYPGDVYDGNVPDHGKAGPWALCTCNFAELYYRVAGDMARDPKDLRWTANTAPFFRQVGVAGPNDPEMVRKLVAAGDRMLLAVIYHSDHLRLGEQFDRDNGLERGVENLTWSYAAFLHAVRTRTTRFGRGFGDH